MSVDKIFLILTLISFAAVLSSERRPTLMLLFFVSFLILLTLSCMQAMSSYLGGYSR